MAGKGRKPEGGVDWKKFRESPYWCEHEWHYPLPQMQYRRWHEAVYGENKAIGTCRKCGITKKEKK
jgi:hypothetical protein